MIRFAHTGATAILLALAPHATAQTIVVTDRNFHHIPHGASSSLSPCTYYPITSVGASAELQFRILNESTTTPLTISNVTITGPEAAPFSILTAAASSVGTDPDDSTHFVIRFQPTASAIDIAQVNVLSNDPDQPTYTFDIEGFGYLGVPPSWADLNTSMKKSTSKPTKVGTQIKGKLQIINTGATGIDEGTVDIYLTPKRYLDLSASMVGTKKLKKIKAETPDKIYSRLVSFKVKTELTSGSVFLQAIPLEPSLGEDDWSGNLYRLQFPQAVD